MSDVASLEWDDESSLAPEYALGVLGGAERRAVERRIARDPAFAREVSSWEERLAPLALAVPDALPSPGLWERVEADLARMTRTPFPASVAAQAAEPARGGRRVSAIWQYLGLGGMGLAAASLAALFLAVTNIGGLLGPPGLSVGQTMTATLMGESGAPLLTVVVDGESGMATFVPVADAPSDAAHVHELWLLPPGGEAPRSLGLLDGSGPVRMPMGETGMDMPDAAIAVSREPAGGSPTGQPTGPVVASGPLRSI